MLGNNDVGSHAFVCDEKLDQNITWKLKGAKLVTWKMWGNKNVGLYTFVNGAKSNPRYIKMQGSKTCHFKKCGWQQCLIICQLKKNLEHELKT
jgi:hypothetical protein